MIFALRSPGLDPGPHCKAGREAPDQVRGCDNAQRAAPDLGGACDPLVWHAAFKSQATRMLRVTSQSRPPGGGRARPGVPPGRRVQL